MLQPVATKPINIRWIRTGSQPYYPRKAVYNTIYTWDWTCWDCATTSTNKTKGVSLDILFLFFFVSKKYIITFYISNFFHFLKQFKSVDPCFLALFSLFKKIINAQRNKNVYNKWILIRQIFLEQSFQTSCIWKKNTFLLTFFKIDFTIFIWES